MASILIKTCYRCGSDNLTERGLKIKDLYCDDCGQVMSEKTIYPEIMGGVLVDVHNLPEGWTYEVIDRDDEGEGNDAELKTFSFNASVEIEAKTEAEARSIFSALPGAEMNSELMDDEETAK